MNDIFNNAIFIPLQNLLSQIYDFLPNFFAMILILILGLIIGLLIKNILVLFLKLVKFDRLSFRSGFTNALTKAGIRNKPSEFIGRFIYWVLFFVFIMLALNALNVEALNALVGNFFLFLPNLLAGFVLFFAGYLISIFVERTVLIAAVNAELKYAKFLAQSTQLLILVFFLAIALEQIGIGREIVVSAFTVIFGGVILALALALGLGGRELGKEWLEKKFGKTSNGKKEEKDMWSHL
ncbi:hypothetical protein ACFLSX_02260 [Calditrichota bacterium]